MTPAEQVAALKAAARNSGFARQRDLAAKAKVPQSVISRVFSGKQQPEPETVARLAKALNLDADRLLGQAPRVLHRDITPCLNPRLRFDPDTIFGLAASIEELGLLEPLVVRRNPQPSDSRPGPYLLIAGEQRYKAIGVLIEEGSWPAEKPIPVHLAEIDSDRDHRLAALAENMARADLTPLEEASAIRALLNDGLAVKEVAGKLGKTERHVEYRLALLKLELALQDALAAGKLTAYQVRPLTGLAPERQVEAFGLWAQGKLSSHDDFRAFAESGQGPAGTAGAAAPKERPAEQPETAGRKPARLTLSNATPHQLRVLAKLALALAQAGDGAAQARHLGELQTLVSSWESKE